MNRIKEKGVQAGVSLNPATSVSCLEEILPDCDLVLIMTVNPGFGGQKFIASSVSKIRKIREMITALAQPVILEVDGGITLENIAKVSATGAEVFVAGAAVFGLIVDASILMFRRGCCWRAAL